MTSHPGYAAHVGACLGIDVCKSGVRGFGDRGVGVYAFAQGAADVAVGECSDDGAAVTDHKKGHSLAGEPIEALQSRKY